MIQLPCCSPSIRPAFLSWFRWIRELRVRDPDDLLDHADAERLDREGVDDPQAERLRERVVHEAGRRERLRAGEPAREPWNAAHLRELAVDFRW